MLILRYIVMVMFVLLLGCSTVAAQSIESVATDYLVKEYCFGTVENEIVFKKDAIVTHGSFAVLDSAAYYADGSPTTEAVADLVFVLCLEKKDQWRVVYDLSRSDVPSAEELDSMSKDFPHRFPKSLLPDFWQRLLK